MGEQDVADQRGAFSRSEGGRPRAGRPLFALGGARRPRADRPPAPPELCASRGGAPRPLRAAGRERILTPRATARRQMPAARARDEP